MKSRWIGLVAAVALPLGLLVSAPAATAAVSPEVVNGEPGVAGDFPYLAYVGSFTSYPRGYACGGSFVSPTQVVTAAHCFFDGDDNRITDVRVGPTNGTARPSVLIPATRVDVHEGYNSRTQANDIALITLSRPASGVGVVTVPSATEWRQLTQAGSAVRSAGWGTTYSGAESSPSNFLVANLRIIPDSVCGSGSSSYDVGSLTYYGLGSSFDVNRMICAGGATSTGLPIDTCQGDSGGPLSSGTGASARLVGIVSWGVGCAGEDEGKQITLTPGVYTRLGAYLPWLADRGVGEADDVSAPGAPTGVSARVIEPERIGLQWTAPAEDGGAAITGYRVEQSIDGGDWRDLGQTETAGTSIDVINVEPGSFYSYRIAAVNSAGTGEFSLPSAPILMPDETLTPPGKVRGFSTSKFIKKGKTFTVTVRWKAPRDDGGAEITGYLARAGAGGNWGDWTDLDDPAAMISELARNTKYTVQVQAVNSQGPGAIATYSFRTPRR